LDVDFDSVLQYLIFRLCKHLSLTLIFDKITGKFQLKINDRESAGNILGGILKDVIKKQDRPNTVVLGIPKGGLIVAESIARSLNCGFDFFVVRRLRSPNNDELSIGAVAEDGTTYINDLIISELKISKDYIENEKSRQMQEAERVTSLYNCNSEQFFKRSDIDYKNATIVIADDGSATGATAITAIRSIRASINPKRLLIALPISPTGTINALKNEDVDDIKVITSPHDSKFVTIEQYYRNFEQVSEEQVLALIRRKIGWR
jgi:putative phosphoribosyl transferase